MKHLARTFVALVGLVGGCHPAMAADEIVVLGKLAVNEVMSYVHDGCPEDAVCVDSWFKSVIQVQKTLTGEPLSGRVIAASLQHTGVNKNSKKNVQLFVLTPIEDPSERAKLRADYYLKGMSPPYPMFCLSHVPDGLGLRSIDIYVAETGEHKSYCFELPED